MSCQRVVRALFRELSGDCQGTCYKSRQRTIRELVRVVRTLSGGFVAWVVRGYSGHGSESCQRNVRGPCCVGGHY